MEHENKIQELKQELFNKYGIVTDRDLIRQLGIKDEDKDKLFAWIRYQCAYEYRDGWNNGREDLKEQLTEFSLKKMEQLTERYIEAEKFIMELNWFERIFCSRKITKFLKSRSDKYNF